MAEESYEQKITRQALEARRIELERTVGTGHWDAPENKEIREIDKILKKKG